MTDTEQPFDFITRPSSILKPPHTKTINEISNIEPHNNHELIDIQNDQREAIQVLINRMNEMDNQTEEYAFIHNTSHQQRSFCNQYEIPQMKQRTLKEDSPKYSPGLNDTIDRDNQLRILVNQKGKEIEFQLSALQIQKFQIIDALITFKQQILSSMRSKAEEWTHLIERQEQAKARLKQQYKWKLNELQQELRSQKAKHEFLMRQKYEERQSTNNLDMHIQELEELNNKLNKQLQFIQAENNDLKDQLIQHAEADALIKQLHEEIRLLNHTLDQNNEYIFDLEQRVATQNLHLADKEIAIRRQMEIHLQQEREEIQRQYKTEFEKIRQQLQEEIRNQLRNDYQNLHEIKSHQQKEVNELQAYYLRQSQRLQSQNQCLQKNIEENELRIKQLNQQLSSSSNSQREFAKKIDNLQLRLKEKDVELNYYKQRLEQLELLKAHPNKQDNILLIDQLNKSNSFAKQSAVSPCSTGTTHLPAKQMSSPRDEMINSILSRIRMKQNYSILSNINQNNQSIESFQFNKGYTNSLIKPVSPQSMILQKQKDLRMKNISFKLQQLRSDIRREIGLISN